MAKIDWKLIDKVALMTMDQDDNKLNMDMVRSLLDALDVVEKQTEATALVVNSGHTHIWTNGFDIDWVLACIEKGNRAVAREFLVADLLLRKRLLTYPMITVAALNGHCFGGGAVLSCCFDFRFMRSDRGFFCIPVIDRQVPILPSTRALLTAVLPVDVYRDLILTGRRLTGLECVDKRVVAAAYNNDELMEKVMAYTAGLNKPRSIIGQMKKVMNAPIVELIEKEIQSFPEGQLLV